MVETNHCGSCGLCCNNVNFAVTREQKERDFADTTEVDDPAKAIGDNGAHSYSYYLHGSEIQEARVFMNGPCIHYDNGCKIYSRRPDDCKKFQRGGKACNEMRRTAGLIYMDDIEIIQGNGTIYSNDI